MFSWDNNLLYQPLGFVIFIYFHCYNSDDDGDNNNNDNFQIQGLYHDMVIIIAIYVNNAI